MSTAEIIIVIVIAILIASYIVYYIFFSNRMRDKDYVDMDELMIQRTLKDGKKK
jgi:hypothetical protein